MTREGTGRPRAPDIELNARVKMRELSFEHAPTPEVSFRGNTRRNSVWGSRRENLPDEVQEGVVYRDAGVRLRIATEVAESSPDLPNGPDREGEETSPEHQRQRTAARENESKEEAQ